MAKQVVEVVDVLDSDFFDGDVNVVAARVAEYACALGRRGVGAFFEVDTNYGYEYDSNTYTKFLVKRWRDETAEEAAKREEAEALRTQRDYNAYLALKARFGE